MKWGKVGQFGESEQWVGKIGEQDQDRENS